MDGVTGNKAAGARDKSDDDSLSFNVSFTTNSYIRITKFHSFKASGKRRGSSWQRFSGGC